MVRSECSIVIDASPEAVFARISDPMNAPKDIPEITTVKNLCGKWSTTWYRTVSTVAGVPIETECEFQEYVLGQRLTVQCTGDLEGRVTWRLEPQDDRTFVSLISEYRLPLVLASQVPESIFQEEMNRQWRTALANVKARVEAVQRAPR
ncbi:MAG: SRPBCC family protein [Sedimentisphaerales bacterium]|nr:SRPBCC family protein [Sedimentisphaerales bacterium]